MKRLISALSVLWAFILLFGCQSAAVSSETAVSSEATTSPESSMEEVAALSFAHTAFQTKEELFNFLRQNSDKQSVNGADLQLLIKDNQITVLEPTFTPPEGFQLYCVEIWCDNSAYIYLSDAYIDRIEERRSSREAAAHAAAQSKSIPQSSYEAKIESSASIQRNSSDVSNPPYVNDELVFEVENELVLQWCTAVWEDPLSWSIKNQNLKPLGNSENPKYYYSVNAPYGTPINYDIYWETDGHYCYARIPASLFSEEAVAEICSFKTTTVPLG